MKKMIFALVWIALLIGSANAAVFNGYTNITESTLTASDELQVWNSGDIRNITVENLWDWYATQADYNLTSFTGQTAWRVFYSDGSGDVKELALGTSGQYLKSAGATSAPTWDTPSGSGDVTGIGDCTGGDCFDGTTDGGTYIKFPNSDGSHWISLGADEASANRHWRLPNDDLPGAGTTSLIYSDEYGNWQLRPSTYYEPAITWGTGLSISGATASLATTELDDVTWGAAAGGSQTWTFDTGAATDPTMTISDNYFTFNKVLQCAGIETTRSATVGGSIIIGYEGSNNGDNYIGYKSPDSRSTTLIYLEPTADPSAGQVKAWSAPDTNVTTGTWADLGDIPANDDPDVTRSGSIKMDTDGWLRTTLDSGTTQKAVGRVQEEIHVSVYKPQDLDDAQRDHFWVWSNESGMSFVVTGWKGWSTSDDTTLNIAEEDADGANDATVDAVELATGAGPYTGGDTTITAATIENGHLLYLDFDDTDAPAMVKMTIIGYYNADVN